MNIYRLYQNFPEKEDRMCVCVYREKRRRLLLFKKKKFIYEAEPSLSFCIFDLPCGT